MDHYEGEETLRDREQVKLYLQQNYKVDDEVISSALQRSFARDLIEDGIKMQSMVYFIGDQIALMESWEEIEDDEMNS